MHDFEYVSKKEYMPVKKQILELIHLVQNEVRDEFTFDFRFIGSASRNMITRDKKGNTGYDFDINLYVNDDENDYKPGKIRNVLRKAFDKYSRQYGYDFAEDSKRVITLKVKDTKNSRVLHSCDFAVVNDYEEAGEERQEFIFFNKKQNQYKWQSQPEGFYELPEKIQWIKDNGLWLELREKYIQLKNMNMDHNKKSRSIFASACSAICNEYGAYEEDSDWDD